MPTTRSTYLLRRLVGLAAVPALLLAAAACGDDDDGADGASFCDNARSVDERMSELDDPSAEEFGEALDAVRSMDPPAEIADDWNVMIEALEGFEDIDLENPDPDALAALDSEEAQAASDRVEEYMSEECGI